MRRRSDRPSEVAGPNSALTSFLREQGISAAAIRTRHLERMAQARTRQVPGDDEEILGSNSQDEQEEILDSEEEEEEEEVDAEEEVIRIAARRKRRRRNSEDDDAAREEALAFGSTVDFCGNCESRFTITVYTVKDSAGNNLCNKCGGEFDKTKKKAITGRKQRKKVARALLDGKIAVNGAVSLQDVCINTIVKYIENIEAFGDIRPIHLGKISRILSRNRKLNGMTMKLFMDPSYYAKDITNETSRLEFWDCSNFKPNDYSLIASHCYNLESLILSMCGQMTNENLILLSTKLTNLTELYLDGPFLINKESWNTVFENLGSRLKSLTIKSTHRIASEELANLVENCPNLTKLCLSRLSGVIDETGILLLSELRHLTHLEISYIGMDPLEEPVVSDESIINILNSVGSQLQELVLDGCSGLTNQVLTNGINKSCRSLRTLSLTLLDQITDDAVVELFTNWNNPGLEKFSCKRCIGFGDDALMAVIDQCRDTIVELDINSLQVITAEGTSNAFFKLKDEHRPHKLLDLTQIDLGFVRCVDDRFITKLCNYAPNLESIEVWGNNKVTEYLKVPQGVKLIGRENIIGL